VARAAVAITHQSHKGVGIGPTHLHRPSKRGIGPGTLGDSTEGSEQEKTKPREGPLYQGTLLLAIETG
jgi:hypothetical protein